MLGADSCIGDFVSCYCSIQDVIALDAVVQQSSGIEFSDGAGLATEAAIGIAPVVPDIIDPAISFSFDQTVIVARVLGLDKLGSGLPVISGS